MATKDGGDDDDDEDDNNDDNSDKTPDSANSDLMLALQQNGTTVDELVDSATQKKLQSAVMQEKTFGSHVDLHTDKLVTTTSSGAESFVSSMDESNSGKVEDGIIVAIDC